MKKIVAGGFLISMLSLAAFAGDASVLVDRGFSSDGNYYIFGQYGKTDVKYQGYAELYTVDVEKNDYVSGGVFRTAPSKETSGKSGKDVFETLEKKSSYALSKYQVSKSKADQILYIREEESKDPLSQIVFKDFTRSIGAEQASYFVQLIPEYTGSGVSAKSSFFIMVEKRDANGNVLARQKVGSPLIRRSGVTGYKIERIVCDESGRNLVFIIEKKVQDASGTNIRYMIEACRLSEDFSAKVQNVTASKAAVVPAAPSAPAAPVTAAASSKREELPVLSVTSAPSENTYIPLTVTTVIPETAPVTETKTASKVETVTPVTETTVSTKTVTAVEEPASPAEPEPLPKVNYDYSNEK